MLRCIAIDDEPPALELLADYISKVDYLELVTTCSDPLEAIRIIEDEKINLVLLDIQMPRLSGIQLMQSLSHKPLFILVTAYDKYAVDAFYFNAVDYLVKPVPFDRFLKATDKAKELFDLTSNTAGDPKNIPADHIFIYADSTWIKLRFDEILWIEGQKDYVRMHLANNIKPVVARSSMKQMEEQLPTEIFTRIQKSYIVSKIHISAIRKNSVFVGQVELPVGEMYRDSVQSIIGKLPD